MREQILNDINLILQKNYNAPTKQFINEKVDFSDVFKTDEQRDKEPVDVEQINLSTEQVAGLKELLLMLKERADATGHKKSVKELVELAELADEKMSLTKKQIKDLNWFMDMGRSQIHKKLDEMNELLKISKELENKFKD